VRAAPPSLLRYASESVCYCAPLSNTRLATGVCLPCLFCAGDSAVDTAALLAAAGDYLAEALDREQGAAVTDPAIFRAHAQKYEVRVRRLAGRAVFGAS
jgi:hypothetical protein